ncbi:MAG TPA: hypothetical protein VHZ51_29490 [Ktedonobacteraceae bacterium]|jgi:hypothetical protein|nr:hypothetical protein [Ktedonobacteraceae bacterium]
MLRPRTSEQIRIDAIKMGVKKAREGCLPCMNQYFALAREHGASQAEIECALASVSTEQHGIPRRKLLKIAAAGGLAAATAGLGIASLEYASNSHAQSVQTWWGTDSSSQTGYELPQNFYIGRMGWGKQPQGDALYFNVNAANAAGRERTFGYWGLVGPGNGYRGSTSPFDWGKRQADCAWNGWNHGPHATSVGSPTIFVDIESGFGGWTNGNYTANQQVVNGFLQELFNITPRNTWPGMYISPNYWKNLLGTQFKPTTPFVLWITGCYTCGTGVCGPADNSCSTQTSVQGKWKSHVGNVALGGQKPVLWQYWISNCGCGDYNVCTQNSTSLIPIPSDTLYANI